MAKVKYTDWTLIEWDGNPALKFECYRKSFSRGGVRGHVSVGVGEFNLIVYSYGASSDDSLSSTRWRKDGKITVEKAMEIVDSNNGEYIYSNDN